MRENSFTIRGVVPIIPTPFELSGGVDWQSLSGLIDFAYAAGACAVCLPAYASEFYKLSPSEHERIVTTAISASGGRIPVIAQVNTPSLPRARELSEMLESAGADAMNIAVPRLFAIGDAGLFRYFDEILRNVSVPVVIQDFNPAGASISVDFIVRLHEAHPNFQYVKLEEPMMCEKVRAIGEATARKVGVLEGWGGMYLPELIPAGICGIMPGLAVSDLLVRIWNLSVGGERDRAFDIFSEVLPQIVYSLQNMELFHHAEKLLLRSRGVLSNAVVRDATMTLSEDQWSHLDFLNSRILALLDRLGMPRNPVAVKACV